MNDNVQISIHKPISNINRKIFTRSSWIAPLSRAGEARKSEFWDIPTPLS